MYLKKCVLIILCMYFSSVLAQNETTYNLRFLRAKTFPKSKAVIALFHLTPKNKEDFPPIFSMQVGYGFEKGIEKTVNVLKENDNVSIILYNDSLEHKNKRIYDFIKDRVDLNDKNDFFIIEIHLTNVYCEPQNTMTIRYGLWEKNNQNMRVEENFEFKVE